MVYTLALQISGDRNPHKCNSYKKLEKFGDKEVNYEPY